MALPTAYLTSSRNLDGILSAIQTAQAPQRFTLNFLENLGYKSSSDRLIINVLKALGFLTADGGPTDRYYRYLDQTEAGKVLAEGLHDAYADLYQLNRSAHELGRAELKNKFRTLTQGQPSDAVLGKMASTFEELAKRADFSAGEPSGRRAVYQEERGGPGNSADESPANGPAMRAAAEPPPTGGSGVLLGGLVYSIQIHLPESRDQAVYDALFRSLKNHLLQ